MLWLLFLLVYTDVLDDIAEELASLIFTPMIPFQDLIVVVD